jgi:salicylate hydroxylase
LVLPNFGKDLQKLADDTNKKLPHIWWSDLEGDCEAVKSISGSFGSDQRRERILIRASYILKKFYRDLKGSTI